MYSTEASPLFDTHSSCTGQIPLNQVRPDPSRSAVNPLAAMSLLAATTELDGLATRVIEASQMRKAYQAMPETPISESSPGHAPSSTPTRGSPFSSTNTPGTQITSFITGSETPVSPRGTLSAPLNKPVVGISTPSDNILGALQPPRKHRRRKTSSRRSEIYTHEDILEGFDEDHSLSGSISPLGPTHSSTGFGSGNFQSSLTSPTSKDIVPVRRTDDAAPQRSADRVEQAFQQARLTQDELPKVFRGDDGSRRTKIPRLRVGFANLSSKRQLQKPENFGLGLRSYLKTSLSYPALRGNDWFEIADLAGDVMPPARAVVSAGLEASKMEAEGEAGQREEGHMSLWVGVSIETASEDC